MRLKYRLSIILKHEEQGVEAGTPGRVIGLYKNQPHRDVVKIRARGKHWDKKTIIVERKNIAPWVLPEENKMMMTVLG